MRRRLRPAAPVAVLLAVLALCTGCTVPRPEVTFYGNRASVSVQPEFWCSVDPTALTLSCPPTPDTARDGHLTMGRDQPLQISVPGDVGDTPWLVYFQYVDSAGKPQSGRSAVFTDRLAFTLPSPAAGSQLTRVEVQAGLVPALNSDGSTGIAASRTWVLVVSPKQPTGT